MPVVTVAPVLPVGLTSVIVGPTTRSVALVTPAWSPPAVCQVGIETWTSPGCQAPAKKYRKRVTLSVCACVWSVISFVTGAPDV